MLTKDELSTIERKIHQYHTMFNQPVVASIWEEIFDSAVNGPRIKWETNHSSGADVIHKNTGIRYQLKSGKIDFEKNTLEWSGHRTGKYKTILEKINFISKDHHDQYVMLSREDKEWKKYKIVYNLLIFDASLIDYQKLNWTEQLSEGGPKTYIGYSNEIPYTAKIIESMSGQLWTICTDISYLGDVIKIEVNTNHDTEFFEYQKQSAESE